jgi:hypothetical protein
MKQKDIATILGIAGFATILAVVISNYLLAPPTDRKMEVKVLDSISGSFPTADKKYFNDQSVNSTQLVQIGGTNNAAPFPKSTQPR